MIVWKLDDVMRRKRAKGREMARRMGIGENYLSRVRHEVPDRLSLVLLDSLCHELDCTIADLLEYQPGPSPAPAPPPPVERPKRPAAPRR
ncbi:MAG: helix-turn-helix domain-containing protein, partial [Candidatus Sericytochromatia bacterium]